jgi:hypothetical protein
MRARVRKRKSGKIVVYYFYDTGGKLRKEIPLGNDYVTAVQEWAKLESAKLPESAIITFNVLADRFESEHAPTKTASTQKAIRLSLKRLRQFFDGAPLDEIQPQHIASYLEWRKNSPAAANNDIQWFTAAWNQARSWGYTEKANPAVGVKRHTQKPRDVYIDDRLYGIVYQAADSLMRDLMDTAYITGQRPIDIVGLHTDQIHDGILHITQRKTKARLRFEISGLLAEIIGRRAPEDGGYLFKNSRGGRLTRDVLGRHFLALRKQLQAEHPELAEELANFQFRDLRAKSGTDAYLMTGDKNAARQQLGHTTEAMTNRYIRQEQVLKPLK